MITTYRVVLISSLIMVVMLVLGGVGSYNVLQKKAAEQENSLMRLQRWKAAYQALQPVRQEWNRSFMDSNKVEDLLSMYRMLNIESLGLAADAEKVQIRSIQVAGGEGARLGLTRANLVTGGDGAFFTLHSRNFTELLNGFKKLAERRDIDMAAVTLTMDGRYPVAKIEQFSVYLRTAREE